MLRFSMNPAKRRNRQGNRNLNPDCPNHRKETHGCQSGTYATLDTTEGKIVCRLFVDSYRQALATNSLMSQNVAAATAADAGMVKIHAQTMRPATPQRTADRRLVEPTPT